uniref:Uncharacterized protein n=1 Tax=Oryza brachyantha TaxID=4533 RepID=J3NCW4_ORYBR
MYNDDSSLIVTKTALSNFEAALDYRNVPDLAVMLSFPIVGGVDNAALVAWTTTPWTFPSNLALCVNANLVYAKAFKYTTNIELSS